MPRKTLAVRLQDSGEQFNPEVPFIFRTESTYRMVPKELAAQIVFLATMGPEQTTGKEWGDCYRRVWKILADDCFLNRRILGNGEFSQLQWLKQCGCYKWFIDKHRVRSNMNLVMDKYNAWYFD